MSEAGVAAVTVPVPAGVKVTLLLPGVGLKFVPVIVSVSSVIRRPAVESVTVGAAKPYSTMASTRVELPFL